jgi:hypothetical protein
VPLVLLVLGLGGAVARDALVLTGPGSLRLQVTPSSSVAPGAGVRVKAEVVRPLPGQTLTLELPEGWQLLVGEYRQPVGPAGVEHCRVDWTVQAGGHEGEWKVRVLSNAGPTRAREATVQVGAGG